MHINLLDIDTVNELPAGDPVWVVFNESQNTAVAHQHIGTNKFIIITFLKEEDARHFARIQKHLHRDNNYHYIAKQLRPLFDAITQAGDNVGLLGPHEARAFFQEAYPGLFPDYYE